MARPRINLKRPPWRRRMSLAAGVLVGGFAIVALTGERPQWIVGGTRPVLREGLLSVGNGPVRLKPEARIVFEGDSNVAGGRVGGTDYAFPALFSSGSGHVFKISNQGIGGATAIGWKIAPSAISADLFVIMLGSNDAAPRGFLARRTPSGTENFERHLHRIVLERVHTGAQVLIIAPPPTGAVAMDRRIHPYRLAARRVALATRVNFADPAEAFMQPGQDALLQYDALHLTRHGHDRMAVWLKSRLSFDSPVAGGVEWWREADVLG